ncbi:glutamate ABC transporter substrate-binding protein [Mycobacterium manitobense]|uniref:Glutamate ABC transporter substrate-binding protein n=1 Tax=[Mycobacterium] manitobense TaxID=190147 RepID=A0A9X3BXK2_9MYCO|nr:glutamate ABC transporter substrate-binding protein [[Mycobacterium] manitobense]MCV7172711.1 glutamate ABC transporter substrate-binding protein [[Mycobacterium] manitobense]
MRARWVLVALAVVAGGCGSPPAPPAPVNATPAQVRPAGATEITAAPGTPAPDCDREASLRPGPMPEPGNMPANSTMAAISERGRLVVGVDQNTFLFGYRNPTTGHLEGFDIDLAREIARRIFGDDDRIDLRVVDAAQRETALTSGQVDLVVRTYSVTCQRREKLAFSTVYFYANQRILAVEGSGIDSAATLARKRVCAVSGTTSLSTLFALEARPTVVGVTSWTDCLVMLQQGQIDAISTDDVVLAGLAEQDPSVDIVGPSMGVEPYAIGIRKDRDDLVRFVNGALDEIRSDGTWQRLYSRWLDSLGPSPGPPAPRYGAAP